MLTKRLVAAAAGVLALGIAACDTAGSGSITASPLPSVDGGGAGSSARTADALLGQWKLIILKPRATAPKDIAEPAGLTPAWWQVLGATLDEPLPVAEIARRVGLGLARQSVQRTADLLVDKGWATYRDNPQHRRAKLLEPTPAGRATLLRLREAQHAWADAVGAEVGVEQLTAALGTIRTVIDASRRARLRVVRAGGRPSDHEI